MLDEWYDAAMRWIAMAMHLPTTRHTYKGETYTTYLLRHTCREGCKESVSHSLLSTVEA